MIGFLKKDKIIVILFFFSLCFIDSDGKLLREFAGSCEKEEAAVKLLNILLDIETEMIDIAKREVPMLEDENDPEFMKKIKAAKKCSHCHQKLHMKRKQDTNGKTTNYDVLDHDRK